MINVVALNKKLRRLKKLLDRETVGKRRKTHGPSKTSLNDFSLTLMK